MSGNPVVGSSRSAAGQDEVRVWVCRTDGRAGEVGRYEALVPPDIVEKARRLRSSAARGEAIIAAAFLRSVLARSTGADPRALVFTSTCRWCGDPAHGKPALAGPDGARALSFSLAHTAGLAVLAVGPVEVGVDVERLADPDVRDADRLVLSREERARVAARPARDQAAEFLGLWTRKESYLKGIGIGVVRDPRRVTFAARSGAWATVLDAGAMTPWRVRSLELEMPWIGAVAVDAPGAVLRREVWP